MTSFNQAFTRGSDDRLTHSGRRNPFDPVTHPDQHDAYDMGYAWREEYYERCADRSFQQFIEMIDSNQP